MKSYGLVPNAILALAVLYGGTIAAGASELVAAELNLSCLEEARDALQTCRAECAAYPGAGSCHWD